MILWTKNVYLSVEQKCGERKPKGLLFLLTFSVSLFKNGMTILRHTLHSMGTLSIYCIPMTALSGHETLNGSRVLINISQVMGP